MLKDQIFIFGTQIKGLSFFSFLQWGFVCVCEFGVGLEVEEKGTKENWVFLRERNGGESLWFYSVLIDWRKGYPKKFDFLMKDQRCK